MIIYFSSTGNSMTIAKGLAKRLGDQAVHINQALKQENLVALRIGLVYPVHNYDMPNLVQEFVNKFDFSSAHYIYGIITHGGDKGNSFYTFKKLLEKKGQQLSYINDLLMPVNSRIMYGMITDKIEERTGKQSHWLDSVAKEIEVNSQNADQIKRKTGVSIMNSLVDGNWSKRMFTPVVDQAKCVSCGICQSVCPVDNILVSDNGAKIEDKCENCMSCMHWCPEVAIKFKRRNVRKKQQYHHPDVKLKDIIKSVG